MEAMERRTTRHRCHADMASACCLSRRETLMLLTEESPVLNF
jgi:hypothetical protein